MKSAIEQRCCVVQSWKVEQREPALPSRRSFLQSGLAAAGASLAVSNRRQCQAAPSVNRTKLRFGLVTYMWGADWDLPTLLENCEKTNVLGVELRTEHAHGVEPSLSKAARSEVRKRFRDSPVALVGLGSNEDFHEIDQNSLRKSIERAKAFVELSHDVGGSGVKVKPNDLPPEAPKERTIEQIGRSLNKLAAFADGFGQDIRLEAHGQCASLSTMAAILKFADHPRVGLCWNSNPQDLEGAGIDRNFALVQGRLGKTVHVRKLDGREYPIKRLIQLLAGQRYNGWILLEAVEEVRDRVAALARQRTIFDTLVR